MLGGLVDACAEALWGQKESQRLVSADCASGFADDAVR